MRKLAVLLCALLLSSCVAVPQDRPALIKTMKDNSNAAIVKTHVSSRGYDDVVNTLKRKWSECFNMVGVTRLPGGGGYKEIMYPEFRAVSNAHYEFTLRLKTEGMTMLATIPEGGEYKVALDVGRMPGNKTRLSWYSGSGRADYWEKSVKWSDGENPLCTD